MAVVVVLKGAHKKEVTAFALVHRIDANAAAPIWPDLLSGSADGSLCYWSPVHACVRSCVCAFVRVHACVCVTHAARQDAKNRHSKADGAFQREAVKAHSDSVAAIGASVKMRLAISNLAAPPLPPPLPPYAQLTNGTSHKHQGWSIHCEG